jgi:hypothetical protein
VLAAPLRDKEYAMRAGLAALLVTLAALGLQFAMVVGVIRPHIFLAFLGYAGLFRRHAASSSPPPCGTHADAENRDQCTTARSGTRETDPRCAGAMVGDDGLEPPTSSV